MRKKQIFSLLILFLLLFGLPVAQAKQVTARGLGASDQEAVSDALRRAVEQTVGTLITAETLVENHQIVKDEIYANSRGFVNGFEILEQNRRPDGTVTVTVRAEVDTNPNSALISELQRLNLIKYVLQDPRIAVIIPEIHLRARILDPAGETAVIRKLLEAGFSRLADQNQIAAIRYSDTAKALMNGDIAVARALSARLGIDYIMIGEAFSEFAGPIGGGLVSCRARLEARLIKADTGQIVAAHGIHAGGVDITEFTAAKKALNTAGEKMGEYMVGQLMGHAGNTEKAIKLTVAGVPSFAKTAEIERALRGLRGVKNVYIRDYNAGVATIDLDTTVSAQALAGSISGLSAPRLEVTEISAGAIKVIMSY